MSHKGELCYSVHTYISTWVSAPAEHWSCPICLKAHPYSQPITYVLGTNGRGEDTLVMCESCARERNLIW